MYAIRHSACVLGLLTYWVPPELATTTFLEPAVVTGAVSVAGPGEVEERLLASGAGDDDARARGSNRGL